MKVFISWSGELSRQVAEVLREWLPSVLQCVKPYFTPSDIEKGARWQSEISRELQESQVGIFCLTRENLNSQWLMFEAGAISKVVGDSYVCPIMFDLASADVAGPLQQFQATLFNKPEMAALLATINGKCGEDSLEKDVLNRVFEKWWPDLEMSVKSVVSGHIAKPHADIRSPKELLEEILSLSRYTAGEIGKRAKAEEKALLARAIFEKFNLGKYEKNIRNSQRRPLTAGMLDILLDFDANSPNSEVNDKDSSEKKPEEES